MSLTQILKKNYGAETKYLKTRFGKVPVGMFYTNSEGVETHVSEAICYLGKNEDGSYTKSDSRPKGKYLCFYTNEARENFINKNKLMFNN